MDIGDPNNLARLLAWREGGPAVSAVTVDDRQTLDAMRRVRAAGGYVLCPHSAVGWKAAEDLLATPEGARLDDVVVFGTAHPAKFPDVLQEAFGDAQASRFPGGLPAPAPLRIGHHFQAVAPGPRVRGRLLTEGQKNRLTAVGLSRLKAAAYSLSATANVTLVMFALARTSRTLITRS